MISNILKEIGAWVDVRVKSPVVSEVLRGSVRSVEGDFQAPTTEAAGATVFKAIIVTPDGKEIEREISAGPGPNEGLILRPGDIVLFSSAETAVSEGEEFPTPVRVIRSGMPPPNTLRSK